MPSLEALSKVDLNEKVIQYNHKELFDFTHAMAMTGNTSVAPQVDCLFLKNEMPLEFFQAPHMVKLDPTLQYGS